MVRVRDADAEVPASARDAHPDGAGIPSREPGGVTCPRARSWSRTPGPRASRSARGGRGGCVVGGGGGGGGPAAGGGGAGGGRRMALPGRAGPRNDVLDLRAGDAE